MSKKSKNAAKKSRPARAAGRSKSSARAKRAPARKSTRKAATKRASKKPQAVPKGYATVTPYLFCRGAAEALAFYAKAFGAKETMRMPSPDGRLMHAEMRIGSSVVMLADEAPERGATAPPTVGGTAVTIFLYVPNVDKAFSQATAAGATAQMPPMDMFWGDRFAQVGDPFGHHWAMATHVEDVAPKEMGRRMAAEFAKYAQMDGGESPA